MSSTASPTSSSPRTPARDDRPVSPARHKQRDKGATSRAHAANTPSPRFRAASNSDTDTDDRSDCDNGAAHSEDDEEEIESDYSPSALLPILARAEAFEPGAPGPSDRSLRAARRARRVAADTQAELDALDARVQRLSIADGGRSSGRTQPVRPAGHASASAEGATDDESDTGTAGCVDYGSTDRDEEHTPLSRRRSVADDDRGSDDASSTPGRRTLPEDSPTCLKSDGSDDEYASDELASPGSAR